MTRGPVLVAFSLALMAAACGRREGAQGHDLAAARPATRGGRRGNDVRERDHAGGALLRVARGGGGTRSGRGFGYAGIEVKGCAAPNSEGSLMHLGPNAFVLRTPDGTRLHPEGFADEAKAKEPASQGMNPLPGECDRGFVTFQTPRGERPDLVLYEEEFVHKATIARKVPQAR